MKKASFLADADDIYSATVLPMNFGGSRVEKSIVCLCKDLSLISGLLNDPCQHIHGLKGLWKCPKDCPPWRLGAPSTIVMEWALNNISFVYNLCALLNISIESLPALIAGHEFEVKSSEKERAKDLEKAQDFLENAEAETLDLFFRAFLPRGGYLLEFAIDTRTVKVQYFLPSSHTQLFNSDITPQTLVMKNAYSGNLHFDIGSDTVVRAQFISDYMNDPATLLNNILAGSTTFRKSVSNLVVKGSEIMGAAIPNPTGIPTFKSGPVSERTVIMEHRAPVAPAATTLADDPPPGGCVCVDVGVTPNNDGTYNAGPLVVKFYEASCG